MVRRDATRRRHDEAGSRGGENPQTGGNARCNSCANCRENIKVISEGKRVFVAFLADGGNKTSYLVSKK